MGNVYLGGAGNGDPNDRVDNGAFQFGGTEGLIYQTGTDIFPRGKCRDF